MTGREILAGAVLSRPFVVPGPLAKDCPPPLVVLEELLLEALTGNQCLVTFSGGRDSSAVLAVALGVARRSGLPEPIPLTLLYPGVADADESAWQQLVIDHLRPREWLRLTLDPASASFLGPVATKSLVSRGLIWPPTLHLHCGWWEHARGATIITGEGGDAVFGTCRATPLRMIVRAARRNPANLRKRWLMGAAKEASPPR